MRVVVSDSLELEYELSGQQPVQALGTIRGKEFYFHAKYDKWEFEVAYAGDNFPSDGGKGFVVGGRLERAGFMLEEQAIEVIAASAKEYLAEDEFARQS